MMFSNLWKTATIGTGAALVLSLAWMLWLEASLTALHKKYDLLDSQTQAVTIATRQATNNPNLTWALVPAQITALASSNLGLREEISIANGKVQTMATETLRLKAAGDALRSENATVQRERAGYLAKLDALAATPGDHADCPALVSQIGDALDLAWSSGQ